jgi:hypothetical protein
MVILNLEMPLPPSYKCPVCQKEKQRGLIGDHVVTHSLDEIRPYIVNLKEVEKKGVHPEVICSGHTYIICYNKKQGFEKGKPKHIKHICSTAKPQIITNPKENDADMSSMTMNQVLDICRKKNVRGYSHKSKEEIIELIIEHDKLQAQTNKPCTCHNEITQLKAELLEKKKQLEQFRTWFNSAPLRPQVQEETTLLNIVYSDTNQIEHIHEAVSDIPVEKKEDNVPKLSIIKEPKTAVVKASKKEQEKGMYCTKCEVCGTLARNNRELKPCGSCNKLCHFNSDFFSCYHWECAYCNLPVCMDCNKAAGGNKLFAFCSKSCYKKQNA